MDPNDPGTGRRTTEIVPVGDATTDDKGLAQVAANADLSGGYYETLATAGRRWHHNGGAARRVNKRTGYGASSQGLGVDTCLGPVEVALTATGITAAHTPTTPIRRQN